MQESSPTYLSVMHADGDILVKNDYKIPEVLLKAKPSNVE